MLDKMGRVCSPVVGAWYKWVILFAACLTQTFCAGYVNSTMTFMTIYYADRFNDRKIAGIIGTVQSGLFFLTALPAIYLVKRFGERMTHIVGAFMVIAGVAGTAFATEGWQALLGTGVVAGLGCAITLAAPFEILSKYFPGKQLVPYACMSFSYTIGVVVSPQLVSFLMVNLGYTYTLLCCCGTLSVNLLAGFLFVPKDFEEIDDDDDTTNRPKYTLKFKGRKSGVYIVTQLAEVIPPVPSTYVKLNEKEIEKRGLEAFEELQQQTKESDDTSDSGLSSEGSLSEEASDKTTPLPNITHLLALATVGAMTNPSSRFIQSKNPGLSMLRKQNSSLSQVISRLTDMSSTIIETPSIIPEVESQDKAQPSEPKKSLTKVASVNSIKTMITDSYGLTIGELLDDTKLAKKSVKDLLKNPQVMSYFMASFFITASFFCFNTVLGDYARYRLQYNDEEFAFGATVIGLSMLPFGIVYLLLTKYSSFSSSFLHCIVLAIAAAVMLFMLADPSIGEFYILMAVYGMSRTFYVGNLLPVCMEISNPRVAVVTYMTEMIFDGVGGLTAPYLAAYLQVELDMRYGMALSGCLMIVACILLLPIGLKNLISPKTYTKYDDIKEAVMQTAHFSVSEPPSPEARMRQQSMSFTPVLHM